MNIATGVHRNKVTISDLVQDITVQELMDQKQQGETQFWKKKAHLNSTY